MSTSMNFTIFTSAVMKGLQAKMGNNFRIFSSKVKKNNGVSLTGIIVEEKNCNASPTVYIDEFYESYQKGATMSEIVEDLYKMIDQNRLTESLDLSGFTVYEKAKKRIAFKLINYEKNWELLKECPHRIFYNLAAVFYYSVQETPFEGNASI